MRDDEEPGSKEYRPVIDDVHLMCFVCREFDEHVKLRIEFQFLDILRCSSLNSIEFACISIGNAWFLRQLTFASHRWSRADLGQDQDWMLLLDHCDGY